MILKNLIAALVCVPLISIIAHAQVSEPGPTSQSGSTYQLPLAIEKQLAVVKQAAINCQTQKHGSVELISAVNTLQEMIPCSAKTRELLQQQHSLHQKMAVATSQPEYEMLNASARSVSDEIEQDQPYAQIIHAIDARLVPSYRKPAVRSSFPSMSEMQPGDILLCDGRTYKGQSNFDKAGVDITSFSYAQTFTHAGLYLGAYGLGGSPYKGGKNNPSNQGTLESSGKYGVFVGSFLKGWSYPGMHVAIGRVHDVSLISGFVTCIRGYNTFQGTPYHKLSALLSWDKTNTRNGIYCSQLVWYVYNQAHVDLDSNDPSYISWFVEHNKWLGLFDSNYADIAINGVFPDELRASSNITWYYDQTNP